MLAGSCANHSSRAAIGVCVLCRKPICIECSTPMAGIHRCADCLGSMELEAKSRSSVSGTNPLVWAMIAFGLVLSTLGWAAIAAVLE